MKIRIILKYLLEILLAVFLFSLIISLILKFTIFKESYLLKKIEKNNYYESIYNDIQEEMSYYIVQSGLEKEILNNIYTIDDIKRDVNILIHSFYKNEKPVFNTAEIKNRLEDNILKYLTENNIKVSDKKSLDEFVNKIIEVYEESINLSNGLFKISNTFYKVNNFFNIFLMAIIIIIIILTFYSRLIYKSNYGVLSLTVGSLLLLSKFLIIKYIDINNILFYSNEVSGIIKSITFDILNMMKYLGYIFMIYGIIITVVSTIAKLKRKFL